MGNWGEHAAQYLDDAADAWQPGLRYDPHDSETTDANILLEDLLAEPNPDAPRTQFEIDNPPGGNDGQDA